MRAACLQIDEKSRNYSRIKYPQKQGIQLPPKLVLPELTSREQSKFAGRRVYNDVMDDIMDMVRRFNKNWREQDKRLFMPLSSGFTNELKNPLFRGQEQSNRYIDHFIGVQAPQRAGKTLLMERLKTRYEEQGIPVHVVKPILREKPVAGEFQILNRAFEKIKLNSEPEPYFHKDFTTFFDPEKLNSITDTAKATGKGVDEFVDDVLKIPNNKTEET